MLVTWLETNETLFIVFMWTWFFVWWVLWNLMIAKLSVLIVQILLRIIRRFISSFKHIMPRLVFKCIVVINEEITFLLLLVYRVLTEEANSTSTCVTVRSWSPNFIWLILTQLFIDGKVVIRTTSWSTIIICKLRHLVALTIRSTTTVAQLTKRIILFLFF